MQKVLTPSGYRDASTLAAGDSVSAFDSETGAPIVNHVETVQPVDYAEWCRWWQVEEAVPPFKWVRVNSKYLLFSEQSIWRNGTNVCHARDLIVGDEIYDDADQPITITKVETAADESFVWYRFDIDNDHSYIVDGLTVHNASRFWVGGTGTWDSSTTTHWASSSGNAGGQSVPGSADSVTFDGSSGGGTVTLNYGGAITIQSLAMGAFTGTWDNSVNNNNISLSAVAGFNGSGVGARTIKLGSATYTLTAATNTSVNFTTSTNLTFDCGTSTITFTGGGSRSFFGGGLTFGTVSLGASSGSDSYTITGASTFAYLNITAPNYVVFPSNTTITVANTFTWNGNSSAEIAIVSSSAATVSTVAAAAGSTMQWCAFRAMTFSGSPVALSSFDLGNNTGVTITPPGGGSFGVIGS